MACAKKQMLYILSVKLWYFSCFVTINAKNMIETQNEKNCKGFPVFLVKFCVLGKRKDSQVGWVGK
jgi:hypothetical protein